MSADIGEVVVDGMHGGIPISADSGSTARDIVNIVPLESNLVLCTVEQQSPVMFIIASRRPGCSPVVLVVSDRDAAGSDISSYQHLSANKREFAVVDPDLVGAYERDRVTSPNVLRVEIRDVDVLDNHICGAVCEAQTHTTEDAGTADTNNALVAADGEGYGSGFVVGDLNFRG